MWITATMHVMTDCSVEILYDADLGIAVYALLIRCRKFGSPYPYSLLYEQCYAVLPVHAMV